MGGVMCLESQVHHVNYLCTGEPLTRSGTFPAMDKVLYHSGVRTQYADGIFQGKKHIAKNYFPVNKKSPKTNKGVRKNSNPTDCLNVKCINIL